MFYPTIAIDPGSASSAAVALIRGAGQLRVWWGFKKTADIAHAIKEAFDSSSLPGHPIRLVIERVHAMPGQGVTSMFTFGRGTGVGFGALFAHRPDCPVYEVTPQTWQKYYGRENFDSTEVVPTIFLPDLLPQCRQPRGKLNHNACDAALIAYWAADQPEANLKVSEHWSAGLSQPRSSTAARRGTSS